MKRLLILAILTLVGWFVWTRILPLPTISHIQNRSGVTLPKPFSDVDASNFNGGAAAYVRLNESGVATITAQHDFQPPNESDYEGMRSIAEWRKLGPLPLPPLNELLYLDGRSAGDSRPWHMILHSETGGVWAVAYHPDMAGD